MRSPLKSLLEHAERHAEIFGIQYYSFTCFVLIYYGIPFQFWSDLPRGQATESVILRSLASALSFFLMFGDVLSERGKQFFPLYWYFVLIFSLPFVSAYMMLSKMVSFQWFFVSIFLLSILVNWISFAVITIIGCLSALFIAALQGKLQPLDFSDQTLTAYICVFGIVIISLFLRKRDHMIHERIKAYKDLSEYIAHEMRKPLGFIRTSSEGFEQNSAKLFEGYEAAVNAGIYKSEINQLAFNALKNIPREFKRTSSDGLLFIEMLLMQTRHCFNHEKDFGYCIALDSVKNALQRWNLGTARVAKINVRSEYNFRFRGIQILVDHLILELLRNSEYFIDAAKKTQIDIWCARNGSSNEIHFKDNGCGIDKDDLKHIFKRGFSKRLYGTGLGLGFCRTVMKHMGGSIRVDSKKDCYTEVILSFPGLRGEKEDVAQSNEISNYACVG
jgi:signal transduction histidine kinase